MNITNKEKIIDENKIMLNYNVPCQILMSRQINPKDYPTREEFIQEIEKVWNDTWKLNYELPDTEYATKSIPYSWKTFVDQESVKQALKDGKKNIKANGMLDDIELSIKDRIILGASFSFVTGLIISLIF